MKRIGEILMEAGFVTAAALERALAKQMEIPRRLCSLLIAHDLIDMDTASRALGEQFGVPAALQKHIDARDRELAALIPAELARSWCVLPLGRTGKGDLIVCARDPNPAALAAIAAIVPGRIVLAVAPASVIETLVADTYGRPEEDFDVDLTTGPIHSLDLDPLRAEDPAFSGLQLVELDDRAVSRNLDESGMIQVGPSRQTPLPPSSVGIVVPPLEAAALPPPAPRTLTPPSRLLAELPVGPLASEPAIVHAPLPPPEPTKPVVPRTRARPITAPAPEPPPPPRPRFAPSNTTMGATAPPRAPGVVTRKPPTIPPAVGVPASHVRPATRMPTAPPLDLAPPEFDPKAIAAGTEPPRRKAPTVQPWTTQQALEAIATARTREAVTAASMRFASTRWRAALLLEVRDKIAAGEAGHGQLLGEDIVVALALPLSVPSLVAQAVERGTLETEPPESAVQDRLDRLLGLPRFPAVVPIVVARKPAYVLAVGDPISGDTDTAMTELERIADALGVAYTKLSR